MHYQKSSEIKSLYFKKQSDSIRALYTYIRRHFFAFLIVVSVCSILSNFAYRYFQYYEGSIELIVNPAQTTKLSEDSTLPVHSALQQSSSLKRIAQLVYSEEMFLKLDEQFDLQKIYGIDKSEHSASILYDHIKSKISISINQFDVITISVKDDLSAQRSAEMANFIAAEALKMNLNWYSRQLIQKLKMDSLVNGQLRSIISEEEMFFQASLKEINSMLSKSKERDSYKLEQAYLNLNRTLSSFDEHLSKYMETTLSNKFILTTLNDQYFSEMIVLRHALPGLKVNNLHPLILIPLTILLSFLFSIILFYMIQQTGKYIIDLKMDWEN
ncbi:MAG: hypothetical protein KBH11_13720 [Bacteroidia bacterium]|nr:hypothetical protein [Bacteroidia bacterium]